MADSKQFGSPRVLQFGDRTAGNLAGDMGHCAQCEAMLADALDGTLSAADQELFDAHMAQCGPCAQSLADARRGAAWLEMLRTPAPEPPPALLERILFQTSGQTSGAQTSNAQAPLPAAATMVPPQEGVAAMAAYGNVVPFRSRVAAAVRRSPFAQIVLQPRLMMTAAMAFFSIALTMNLTGVHPLSLRASDLQPGSLKRDFYAADARVVRYYEGLRVVYELESRVRDLQTASDTDATAGSTSVQPNPNQPGAQAPVAAPNLNSAPQPGGSQPEHKKPAPRPGTSQREALNQRRRLLAALGSEDDGASVSMRARAERTLA